jgi:hypothetical protein
MRIYKITFENGAVWLPTLGLMEAKDPALNRLHIKEMAKNFGRNKYGCGVKSVQMGELMPKEVIERFTCHPSAPPHRHQIRLKTLG